MYILDKDSIYHAKIYYLGPHMSGKTTTFQNLHKLNSDFCSDIFSTEFSTTQALFFQIHPRSTPYGFYNKKPVLYSFFTLVGGYGNEKEFVETANNSNGIVYVADAQRSRVEANMWFLEEQSKILSNMNIDFPQISASKKTIPTVIQLNKADSQDAISPCELQKHLKVIPDIYIVPTVATKCTGLMDSFDKIVSLVYSSLLESDARGEIKRVNQSLQFKHIFM